MPTATADDLSDFDLSVLLASGDHTGRGYRAAVELRRRRHEDDLAAENERLAAEVEQLRGHVAGLCERVQAQADLLRRRAERPALATVWGDVPAAADAGAADSPDPGDTL